MTSTLHPSLTAFDYANNIQSYGKGALNSLANAFFGTQKDRETSAAALAIDAWKIKAVVATALAGLVVFTSIVILPVLPFLAVPLLVVSGVVFHDLGRVTYALYLISKNAIIFNQNKKLTDEEVAEVANAIKQQDSCIFLNGLLKKMTLGS